MARRLIAGPDAAAALPALQRSWRSGVAFSVDLLGEACVSEAEAEAYRRQYLALIPTLAAAVRAWPANDVLDRDHWGAIPRANISIKISSLSGHLSIVDFDRTLKHLADALRPILAAAAAEGVFVNFDMEQRELKDLTLALFMRCCEMEAFDGGIAMQAYLRSGETDAQRLIDWTHRSGRSVVV